MRLKNTLKFVKLNESGIRMLVVFIAILLVGQLLIKFSQKNNAAISSSPIGDEKFQNVHTVKSGESLWKIAVQYFGDGFKWQEIAKENNIDENASLEEGQELIIPTGGQVSKAPSISPLPTASDVNNPANTSSTSTEAKKYTVAKGDTLWSISESQYGSGYNWVDIKDANKLKNANEIVEGQELFIPNVNPKSETLTKNEQQENAIGDESYTVTKGDNLWKIAVRAYGDGYKWVEIAKTNDLKHPGLIYPSQVLSIPR